MQPTWGRGGACDSQQPMTCDQPGLWAVGGGGGETIHDSQQPITFDSQQLMTCDQPGGGMTFGRLHFRNTPDIVEPPSLKTTINNLHLRSIGALEARAFPSNTK